MCWAEEGSREDEAPGGRNLKVLISCEDLEEFAPGWSVGARIVFKAAAPAALVEGRDLTLLLRVCRDSSLS